MLDWKSKRAGKFAVNQIRDASEEDFIRIKEQARKMFGDKAADTIQKIRDGKENK